MSFPYIVLAIALVMVMGPGLDSIVLVLGIVRCPQFARLIRSQVISVREREYVEATRALGASDAKLLFVHILPNSIAPVIVLASLSIATAISAEAALSFLGLGIRPPTPSWGILLSDGRGYLADAPWMATFGGVAISLAVIGFNLVGDALRDIQDPRAGR